MKCPSCSKNKCEAPKREKMSKSRGNVVTVDEAVYGVYQMDEGYEFRNAFGDVIDHKFWGIWQDKADTGLYFTSTTTGKQPAFLCEVDGEACILLIDGEELPQHPDLPEVGYFAYMANPSLAEMAAAGLIGKAE